MLQHLPPCVLFGLSPLHAFFTTHTNATICEAHNLGSDGAEERRGDTDWVKLDKQLGVLGFIFQKLPLRI